MNPSRYCGIGCECINCTNTPEISSNHFRDSSTPETQFDTFNDENDEASQVLDMGNVFEDDETFEEEDDAYLNMFFESVQLEV